MRTLLSVSLLWGLAGCDGDEVGGPASTVVVRLEPARATMSVGASQTLSAQITGSRRVLSGLASCASSQASVASVARSGNDCIVTAVAIGSATITGTATTGESGVAEIVVQPAPATLLGLLVSPGAATLGVGDSVTLDARASTIAAGVTVTYSYQSQSPAVASVSATGVVRAIAPGTALIQTTAVGRGTGFTERTLSQTIAVTVRARTAGLSDLSVSLASGPTTLAAGESRRILVSPFGPLAAAATFTVSSNAPEIAVANSNLMVTAVRGGSATLNVTASVPQSDEFSATSITRTLSVSVQSPAPFTGFTVTPSAIQPLAVGGTVQLNANYTAASGSVVSATYSSNAPAVATVNANGVVTAVGRGAALITTTVSGAGSGFASSSESIVTPISVLERTPGLLSLAVTPSSAERYVGQAVLLTAAVNGPSVQFATRTYVSDRPNVAAVRSDGVVTAVGPGTATIHVTASVPQNGPYAASTLSATATVSVRSGVRSIALTQLAPSVPVGQTRALTALVVADAGINTAVQFVSRNPSVASVAANGIVTGVAGGTAVVLARAAADTTIADSTVVTVVNNCAAPRTVAFGEIITDRIDSFSCQGDRQLFRFTATTQTEVRFAVSQVDGPLQVAPIVGPLQSAAWEQSGVLAGSNAYALVPAGTWTFAVRSATNPNAFTFGFLTANTLSCADYVTAFGIAIHPVQLYGNCLRVGGYHSRRFYFAPRLAADDLISLRARAAGFRVRIDLFDEGGVLLATSAASAPDGEAFVSFRTGVARAVWAEVSNRAQPAALGPMYVSFTGPRVDGLRLP